MAAEKKFPEGFQSAQTQSETSGDPKKKIKDEIITVRRKRPGEKAISYTVRADPETSKKLNQVVLKVWREQRERVRKRGP